MTKLESGQLSEKGNILSVVQESSIIGCLHHLMKNMKNSVEILHFLVEFRVTARCSNVVEVCI